MFYSDVDKSIIQQCNAALSSFYLKFYLTAISVLLNRILNQTSSVKSWLKLVIGGSKVWGHFLRGWDGWGVVGGW